MELHAVWNRIDQLEQLIISQAKEIDLLRRVVDSTQLAVQQNNALSGATKQVNGYLAEPDHQRNLQLALRAASNTGLDVVQVTPNNPQITPNGLISSPCQPRRFGQQQQRQPSNSTIYKSYLINPFVHPATAIPPVANRVVLRSENSSSSATSHRYSPVMRQSDLNHLSPNTSRTSRTLPANTRWSTGPSLLETLADVEVGGEERPPRRRGWHNFFVELLTCFCPCFGMC